MTQNFEIRLPGSGPRIPLIAHIPHDSSRVPEPWRSQLKLDDASLASELRAMTDAHTEDLFAPATLSRGGIAFVNRLSRLIFDPERFEDDEDEPMSRKGMGAIYTLTSGGRPLRPIDFSAAQRTEILEQLFRPYARALEDAVSRVIESHDRCLIIDCHSFPSRPLPYEDSALERPDLCLGYDPFHASPVLIEALERVGRSRGWSVGRNIPFAGSYVPLSRFRSDARVRSIMIEINRGQYMDEQSGARSASFAQAARLIDDLLAEVMLIEAYRSTRFEAMTPEGLIRIEVDKPCAELDKLLVKSKTNSWCFITAWNPSSIALPREENRARNDALALRLKSLRCSIFEGRGCPCDPDWEPEESILALGITKELAVDLGRTFGQNAIVFGRIREPGDLVDCRSQAQRDDTSLNVGF